MSLVVCGVWRPIRLESSNRIMVIQDGDDSREAKVCRAHAAPQGLCDKLIDALKLLSNQQRDGDSLVASIVTGLWEKSRKGIMDGPRKFIEVVNPSPRHQIGRGG